MLPWRDATAVQALGIMMQWTVCQAAAFLRKQDLSAPAKLCEQNDVNGNDLATMNSGDFQRGLHFTPFLAEKVVQAVEGFLSDQSAHGGQPV